MRGWQQKRRRWRRLGRRVGLELVVVVGVLLDLLHLLEATDCAMETECLLRTLIETKPNWPSTASTAIAGDHRFKTALSTCANKAKSNSNTLALLASQLLRQI